MMVRDGRFLVIRRSRFVRAPRKFCFPGGAIEAGESQEDAIRREWREELGVNMTHGRPLWESVTSWGVQLAWWEVGVALDAVFTPDPQEVESIHWQTVGEMRANPELLESNLQFLNALERGDFGLDAIGGESDSC